MRRRCTEALVDHLPRKRAKVTTRLPDGIRCDDILTDVNKKQWRLGESIGAGAFGEIYLVSETLKEPVKPDAGYVVKIEPHENGPLFVEMNCYLRAAKLEMVQSWLQEKNIPEIGMPHYISSGSYLTTKGRYRFLILPRYGKDLDSIFKLKKKIFSTKTVLTISNQILDILEYLHDKGYAHCDIKGSNLLLGLPDRKHSSCRTCGKKYKNHEETHPYNRSQSVNQVYLLDYGLATRYVTSSGTLKEYCTDSRKAHAGTVQFCSVDAHNGWFEPRSDLENLGYNMLYWLSGKLPWDDLTDPEEVKEMKCKALKDLDTFLDGMPQSIYDYFKYVNKLNSNQRPNYDYLRKLFCKGLLEYGYKNDNRIDFDSTKPKKKVQSENFRLQKRLKFAFDRKPLGVSEQVMVKPMLRSTETRGKKKFNWAKILSSDPEDIIRATKKMEQKVENEELKVDSRLNPTYAMLQVLNKTQENHKGQDLCYEKHEGYTYAMELVVLRNKQRKLEEEQEMRLRKEELKLYSFKQGSILTTPRHTRSKGRHPFTKQLSDIKADAKVAKTMIRTRKSKIVPVQRSYRLRG